MKTFYYKVLARFRKLLYPSNSAPFSTIFPLRFGVVSLFCVKGARLHRWKELEFQVFRLNDSSESYVSEKSMAWIFFIT
jgi:hypothetical protein